MPRDARWLSSGAAAEQLGVTLRTLYRFIDQGELPAYRFGRVIRVRQDDLTAFLDGCRIKPGELEHLLPDRGAGEGADLAEAEAGDGGGRAAG